MKDKYIIQVAPLIPLPVLRTQVFSYWHNELLPAGTLVSIPFYFREISGIVIRSRRNLSENTPIKLKNIKLVDEKRYLSENQIALAQEIASYYFSPLGSVLKLMVPRIVRQKKKPEKRPSHKTIRRKIGDDAFKIAKSQKNKFLVIGNSKQIEKINFDLIDHFLREKKQCLILVPEILFSHKIYEKIKNSFSEEVALIHSRISKGQYYDWWKKIKDGKLRLAIASKQGIYLPFSDLGLIIVMEEQDISFKQWEAMPRYNARRGAEILAELTGAKLVLESSVPSAESYHRAQNQELEFIKTKPDKNNFPKIELVSFEKGKLNPDLPISNILRSRLYEALKNNKQAIIFVNRRGFSTRTICENCKKALKCPKCERALAYSDESGYFRCLKCAYKMDLLSVCPVCGGSQFSHRGIGTQTVEKKIRTLFPLARVARIDADTLGSFLKYLAILRKFTAGEIDIIVGTQAGLMGASSDKIGLIGAIASRDFADGVELNSRSLALARVFQMANLLTKKGTLVIQSFFGNNPLFDYLRNYDLKNFYDRELAIRKKFSYPPFVKFIKLVYLDKSQKKAGIETKKTFDLLVATRNNDIEILGPYEPLSSPRRGLYQRNILIKFDPEKDARDLPIRSVIGSLRKGWSVDVDPVSIS